MRRRWINHDFRESFAKIGTIHRLREIMSAAPWSNHDLLVSFILLFIGLALLIDPAVGLLLRSYAYLNQRWGVQNVALLFAGVGALSLCVTLWCVSPPFWLRLLARMASAFCLPSPYPRLTFLPIRLWQVAQSGRKLLRSSLKSNRSRNGIT